MAKEHIKAVYDSARTAVEGREAMKQAVAIGLTTQYHRVLAKSPEVRIVDMLLMARRQLTDLAHERKRLMAVPQGSMPSHRRTLELEQVEQAIGQVAEGTMLWVNERLGRVPQAPQPAVSDVLNSGEVEVA